MVRLGFVKDADQCPADYHKVFFRPTETAPSGRFDTTIYSRPDDAGRQRFELAVDVPRGAEKLDLWVGQMSSMLQGMGWTQWWLDSFSLSMVLDRYITEALKLWGRMFWASYRFDAVVLIQVGLQREAVNMSVAYWKEKFKHVVYEPEFDFEKNERELAAQTKQRSKKLKSFFTPGFLASKSK